LKSNLEMYGVKLERFLVSLDGETIEALEVISVSKSFKKGALLLKPGEVCQWSYQILDGIARKYYLNEAKQITTELYFLGDIAISFGSYALQNPSTEYIEALTEVKVSAINYIAFQEAKAKHPKLMELDIMLLEYYGLWIEERLLQLRTLSAKQRYDMILEQSPNILKHVPLGIVASYLGISLETLSRIRAKR
jgi:CRP-like cAMP-binding protein